MKKLFLTLSLAIITLFSTAQNIEITPLIGYTFGSKMNFYEGQIKIDDNMSFGIRLGFKPTQYSVIEFSYSGMKTGASWNPYNTWIGDIPARQFDVNLNYFMLGAHQEQMLANDKLYGFAGVNLGMAYTNSLDKNINDIYNFAIGIDLGLKIHLTEKVGIRMQGNLNMPLYFQGFGFFAGVGTGGTSSGLTLNSGAYFVQFGFSGGIFFMLGN